MRKILGSLLVVITSLALISCEHDVDFDKNNRTVDVREDNAELIALGALQSTLLAHRYSPLYDFLDASDLPAQAVETLPESGIYSVNCSDLHPVGSGEGTILYTFSRAEGEPHLVGDAISVTYQNCNKGDGIIYNGTLLASYSNVEGLNDRFVEIDTDSCVANLQESLSSEARIIDPEVNLDGDEIRFRNVADTMVVEVINYSVVEGVDLQEVTNSFEVGKNETAIIVNRKSGLSEDAMTSVDGDQVFSIIERKSKQELCQGYRRTLATSLNGFSLEQDELQIELNGAINLLEGTDDLNSFVNEVRDSRFSITVKQGFHIEDSEKVWHEISDYSFSGFTVAMTYDQTTQAYAYRASGEISSAAIFGTAEISTTSPLLGNLADDYPEGGNYTILGQGLEQLEIVVNGQQLSLQVDYNGDVDGDSFRDVDAVIDTTWDDLMNREFKSSL